MMNTEEHTRSAYGRPDAPLSAYVLISMVFIAVLLIFFVIAASVDFVLPLRISMWDMLLLGVATHKASWLISTDAVLSWVRAPFVRFQKFVGPGTTMHEMPRGKGLKLALGELLVCPWCMGIWVALVFVLGLIVVPDITRIVAAIFGILMISDFLQFLYVKAAGRLSSYADGEKS